MGLSHKHVGPKILAKIQIYILTRAELLFTLCPEIPCKSFLPRRRKYFDTNTSIKGRILEAFSYKSFRTHWVQNIWGLALKYLRFYQVTRKIVFLNSINFKNWEIISENWRVIKNIKHDFKTTFIQYHNSN